MLISDVWAALMTEEGLAVDAGRDDDGDVVLSAATFPPTNFSVKSMPRALTPSGALRLGRSAAGTSRSMRLLVLAPSVSAEAARVALDNGVSYLRVPEGAERDVSGTLLAVDGTLLTVGDRDRDQAARRPRGPVPWATYDAALQLLAAPAPTQAELAARVGVTQPRVAQILDRLDGRVVRGTEGWMATRGLREWLVAHYPSQSPVRLTYLTLDPLVPLAERAASRLREKGVPYGVSGDVAADRLAPWARPQTLHLWVRSAVDLTSEGATPAPSEDANVVVQVPEDPYLLRRTRRARDLMVLDPWRVWLDLAQRGQDEAADHLAGAIADGRMPS